MQRDELWNFYKKVLLLLYIYTDIIPITRSDRLYTLSAHRGTTGGLVFRTTKQFERSASLQNMVITDELLDDANFLGPHPYIQGVHSRFQTFPGIGH